MAFLKDGTFLSKTTMTYSWSITTVFEMLYFYKKSFCATDALQWIQNYM